MEDYALVSQPVSYDDPDRVGIKYDDTFDNIPSDPYNVTDDHYTMIAMKEWQACPSDVASKYFSVINIKRLQKKIKQEIHDRSFGKFKLSEDQSVLDLLHVMMAIYKQYAKDLPYKTVRQVKLLNQYTVEYVAPDMIVNLKQHYGYLNDIKNPIQPIPHPINVNHAGRNELPSVAQLYLL